MPKTMRRLRGRVEVLDADHQGRDHATAADNRIAQWIQTERDRTIAAPANDRDLPTQRLRLEH